MGSLPGTDPAALTGERRPVTALFADVVGSTALASTLDPEDWLGLIDPVLQAMAEAVHRYDGTVTQFAGDAVVALFGAPHAHEDDPSRAVLAGLDILAAVEALADEADTRPRLDVRVGINTGLAVVGEVGGGGRAEYTAMGDAVNVAARIQAAARPGAVWVTETTHRLVRGRFEVSDVGEISAKGKDEPLRAYEIVRPVSATNPRGVPGLHSPMVGRDDQLATLQGALAVAAAGRGRVAAVIGEPGIGKSRLAEELRLRTAEAGTARWATARCVSHGTELAYHLVGELVTALVGATERGDLATALAERLGGDADAAGYLVHLVGAEVPAALATRLRELDRAALQARYRAALTALLRTVDHPHVLLIEDLHWADASSAELLTSVLEVLHEVPALLIATTRPDRDSHGWRLVRAAQDLLGDALVEVRLTPLSGDETRTLMGHLLAIDSLPTAIRRTVLERTEGNPFFLEEIVRSLIEQGAIERRDDRWVATGTALDAEIPSTVHSLLLSRIDRLPPGPRRTLRVAAVLGRRFAPDLLAEALAGDATTPLAGDLAVLEAHGLIRSDAAAEGLAHAFRHALVQEAAYASLLRRERQELHARVAEVLIARHAGGPEEAAALIAHHLEHAGDLERAVEYLLLAGRDALERFASREAHAAYARAAHHLAASPDDDEAALRSRVVADLGQVEAGRTFVPGEQVLAVLDRLLPAAERLGDHELLLRTHLAAVDTRALIGERPSTSPSMRASLERALELADGLDDASLRALPLAYVGAGKVATGDLREGAAILSDAVPALERRGRLAEAGYFASIAVDAFAKLGAFDDAQAWAERAIALGQQSGDPNTILDADLAMGGLHAERGDLQAALEFTRRAVEQADQVGNHLCALVGNFMIGDQRLRLGDAGAAVDALERSGELATYCDAGSFAALSHAWLATARAQLGGGPPDWDEFARALATARAHGDRLGEAEVLHQRARLGATAPDPDRDAVEADFAAAIAIFDELGAAPYLARTLRDHGMAQELAGDAEGATRSLVRARELFEQLQIAWPEPDTPAGATVPSGT